MLLRSEDNKRIVETVPIATTVEERQKICFFFCDTFQHKLHYYNFLIKLLLKLTSIPKNSPYVDIKKQDQRLIIFDLLITTKNKKNCYILGFR